MLLFLYLESLVIVEGPLEGLLEVLDVDTWTLLIFFQRLDSIN